jgi:hypothetical protein
LFHCPEHKACDKLYPPDGYIHTHSTTMGWHRRRVHGVKGVNAHRPKKKPIMHDPDGKRITLQPKPARKPWGSNRSKKLGHITVDVPGLEPQIIVMAGVDGSHCRKNLKPYNQVSAMQQVADATGKVQQQLITIKPRESHGAE